MILKAVMAALALAFASPVPAPANLALINYPGVYRIDCAEGRGTAFKVGKHHFYSVNHVTSMHLCNIGGIPIRNVTPEDGADFSQFDADVPGPNLPVSCEGFHAGEWVWATGYAHGAAFQTAMPVYATYAKDDAGKRVLIGEYAYIPGMSGGAVFNLRGEVVGTVNAYVRGTGISFSVDLREMSVCR